MVSLADSIEEKYGDDDSDDSLDYAFIVFVSSSPERRKGMLPPILTLNDYNIENVGEGYNFCSRCSHIAELDLTDNLLSDWDEIANILKSFTNLKSLNLSNNLLNETDDNIDNRIVDKLDNVKTPMTQLVLNGNNVSWPTIVYLVDKMPKLEELHLSTNNLQNPTDNLLKHGNLAQLYLSCNPISDFSTVTQNLINSCPRLVLLSLAECPVGTLPDVNDNTETINTVNSLKSLNMSTTAISNWNEVDKLRKFEGLQDLRLQGCPFLDELTAHERRMLLIARLPNVKVLNGGDKISDLEREDAERAFIRYYMDAPVSEQPTRLEELIEVHGRLDPLVNIDLTPEINIKVKIYHQDECREENISVRKTVKYFKNLLHGWFNILPANMRLYYYDQELSKIVGPEEMKWAQKGLYTYNVREGDYFVVDEKVPLKGTMRSSKSNNSLIFGSPSPKGYTSLNARTNSGNMNFGGHTPTSPGPVSPRPRVRRRTSAGRTSPRQISPGTSPGSGRVSCPSRVSPGGTASPNSARFSRSVSFNSSPSTKSPVQRNLFSSGSNNPVRKHYGEFHHSKVFREPN
jgi:hypothetical protein